MVSKQEKFRKFLDKELEKMHKSVYPEDVLGFARPTDPVLYKFLDVFLENYSWREDIHGNSMNVPVFDDNDTGSSYKITEKSQQRYDILRWLNGKKYLSLVNNQNSVVTVHDVKEEELYILMNQLQPDITPALVTYKPATKEVVFNGKKRKLQQGKNLKIFHLLVTNPNEQLSKEIVWRAIGLREPKKRDVSNFSKLIANVRTSVGANLKEIQLDNTVTFHADVRITD